MVEFLMAAFILSIGLLGLIALQIAAMNQGAGARGRTTATYIADWVLQRAQVEGQQSYLVKLGGATTAYASVFTTSPGQAVTATTFGGFNVDGVQVTDTNGNNITDLAAQVLDANKRTPIFRATWLRRAYNGTTAPTSTSAQSQEFVVNVTWVERGIDKALSISRIIRY